MRQRELVLEFRTPQCPSFGTNSWGGASPLLATNIPKDSLHLRYQRLNIVGENDEIFPTSTIEGEIFVSPPPATIGDEIFGFSTTEAWKYEYPTTPGWKRFIRGLMWWTKKRSATLGSKSRKKWFPKLDYKNRWPNGWC